MESYKVQIRVRSLLEPKISKACAVCTEQRSWDREAAKTIDQYPKMSDPQNPNPPPSTSTKLPNEINNRHANANANTSFNGQKVHFPNPPDPTNPDPATLREQWRFAIKQYSRWYSHAWGTAILAGVSFFALGWIIKGSNPLPSFRHGDNSSPSSSSSSSSSSSVDDTHKPHHS